MTTPTKPDDIESAVFFLREMNRLLGEQEAPEDRTFFADLSTVLDFGDWQTEDYVCAAQLFLDYRMCLTQLGEKAKAMGYRASIAADLFMSPQHTVQRGTMMIVLLQVKDLSTPNWASRGVFA